MATCTYQFNVGLPSELGIFSIPYFKVDKNMPINQADVAPVMGATGVIPDFNNMECSGIMYRVKEPSRTIYSVVSNSGDEFVLIPNVVKIKRRDGNSFNVVNIASNSNEEQGTVDTTATTGYNYESVFLFLFESADHYFRLGVATSLDNVGVAIPERMKLGYFVQSGGKYSSIFQSMGRISAGPPYGSNDFVTKLTEYFTQNPPHPAPVQSTDPYADGGDSDVSVPAGDFDDTSDPIDFPALPALGAVDSGFITLFNPNLSELQALARYMWTNPLFDISAWKKIFADPMDAILGLSIVPVAVPEGSARPIVVGNIVTDVSMKPATAQFIEVQCGALNVNEFWSAYLDYEPYTKAEIYLPFCGVHQLSVDDIMNKTVEVRYHIDILSGACCAYVKCGDSVLYQFIGQCSSSIPISGNDFTNVINGVLSATTAIGSLVATGGASAPLAVPALSATALNALKPNIEKSGAMGGTGGMLAMQKPYLILTRPRQAHPANQNHYTGYPSFITENLSELSGYTEIEEIHLENVQATDNELDEIVNFLKSGVIF